VRLFVALDLPEAVRQGFRELIARLKNDCPAARWVHPEGMHITLKFIGFTDDKNFDPICAALAPVRSERPVDMNFRGLGFFPNERRPRVAWCGVEASENLAKLARDVGETLEPLGIQQETREFVPHLTLSRLNPAQIPAREMEKLFRACKETEGKSLGTAHATEFYLFESILKKSGAEYRKLRAFPFVKGSA
jgi:2'-5' RNA ligase